MDSKLIFINSFFITHSACGVNWDINNNNSRIYAKDLIKNTNINAVDIFALYYIDCTLSIYYGFKNNNNWMCLTQCHRQYIDGNKLICIVSKARPPIEHTFFLYIGKLVTKALFIICY